MRLSYHAETESLYIDVANGASAECLENCDGVVLDFDSSGAQVGIDRVRSVPQVLKIPDCLPSTAETPSAQGRSNG